MQALQVIGRLLDYPSAELQEASDEMVAVVLADRRLPTAQKSALLGTIETLCQGDLMDHQEEYVGLFERGRSLSLLLFEHVHGESRDRGQAMVDLLAQYSAAGLELNARELPDYLPLFLEYLSTREWDEVSNWLEDIHHILGLLAERLHQRESIYQVPFEALLTLAGRAPDRRELAAVVAAEERDDTPQALDKVWEEEMVTFLGDQGSSCGNSNGLVGQRREELGKVQQIHLSDELATDAMRQQIGGA